MTKGERLAQERAQAQKLLDGTFLVPTKTCRRCGEPALVKETNLERKPWPGTAVDVYVAICLKSDCHYVAAGECDISRYGQWMYGSVEVEFVSGLPYVERMLPQPITPKQRVRLEAFLAETA